MTTWRTCTTEEARAWADGVFKRMWWSGSKASFTAVDWRGDESQSPTLMHGDVSPNDMSDFMQNKKRKKR